MTLSPFRVAQAGVQTSEVAYTPLDETVTTVGSVEVDERQLRRISSKTRGMSRVEKLFVNFTGTNVKAGDPLAEMYSPELYQALQELLLTQASVAERSRAQTALGRSVLGDAKDVLRMSIEKLKLWGVTQEQIDRVLREGKADLRLTILSPISGVVIRKNVVEGEYVAEGQAMFEVADLTHVWVKAQVFENQFALVHEGQAVEASVEAYPGEIFPGTVAFVDPVLDPQTRTVTVRYDLENPKLRLSPGMFATVTLKTPVAKTPEYLASHPPRPEPADHLLAMTPDEQEYCLVTNLKLGTMGKPVPVEVKGRKLWMCCEGCEPKIKNDPTRYLVRLQTAPRDSVLSVPESSVIDTGTKKLVYVETEPGVFEGRQVVLGPISGNRYPVLEGLFPGEKVATAGSFLIDAENRLNPRMAPPAEAATHDHAH